MVTSCAVFFRVSGVAFRIGLILVAGLPVLAAVCRCPVLPRCNSGFQRNAGVHAQVRCSRWCAADHGESTCRVTVDEGPAVIKLEREAQEHAN